MGYTAKELEAFVKELDLPADKAKLVLDSIGADEKVLDRFGQHVLRQADYSTKMNALQADKARLEKEHEDRKKKEDEFYNQTAQWKTAKEKEAQKAIEDARAEAEEQLEAVRERIKKLAEKNGIGDDEIKDLVGPAERRNEGRRERRTEMVRDETGRFVSKEEFTDTFKKEGVHWAKLIPHFNRLEREYRSLYGADAADPDFDKVIDKVVSSGKKLSEVFDDEYKLSDKRKEAAETQRKKDIEEAERRGGAAERSKLLAEHPEMSSRTVTRERPGSAILDVGRKHAEMKEPPKHGNPRDAVSAAVQAFRSGKYKDGKETAA